MISITEAGKIILENIPVPVSQTLATELTSGMVLADGVAATLS